MGSTSLDRACAHRHRLPTSVPKSARGAHDSVRRGVQQAEVGCSVHGSGPGGDVQLRVHRPQMGMHGTWAELEPFGHFVVVWTRRLSGSAPAARGRSARARSPTRDHPARRPRRRQAPSPGGWSAGRRRRMRSASAAVPGPVGGRSCGPVVRHAVGQRGSASMARQVAAAPKELGGLLVGAKRGRDDRQTLQQVLDIADETAAGLDRAPPPRRRRRPRRSGPGRTGHPPAGRRPRRSRRPSRSRSRPPFFEDVLGPPAHTLRRDRVGRGPGRASRPDRSSMPRPAGRWSGGRLPGLVMHASAASRSMPAAKPPSDPRNAAASPPS